MSQSDSIRNPYVKGRRSYDYFDRLVKGRSVREIQKEFRLKSPSGIYKVRKNIKRIRATQPLSLPPQRTKPEVTKTNDTEPRVNERVNEEKGKARVPGENAGNKIVPVYQVDEAGIAGLRRDMENLKELIAPFVQGNSPSVEDPSRSQVVEGELTEKRILLTSKTLFLYDIVHKDGYPGNLSSFVNDMVSEVFDKRNVGVGLITRRFA